MKTTAVIIVILIGISIQPCYTIAYGALAIFIIAQFALSRYLNENGY